MIKIENLRKSYGEFVAVNDISFSVQPGEVLGFLGPNGAGKSTTMKIITGFIRPASGSVSVFDHDISKNPIAAKSLIGYLPEGAPAYGDMTVSGFLEFIAEIRGYTGSEKQKRVEYVTQQLALESVLHRPIDNLSKGFKRRVGIAQAIIHDPRVLILDEPTDGLDPNQKHQVRELIRGLSKDKIVIISTHILEEVSAVCSRAIIIANGRVVADAAPLELATRSRYHRAITIELNLDKSVADKLNKLSGLETLEVHPDIPSRYTLIPEKDSKDGSSLFDRVNQLIVANVWEVKELYVESGRLDDIFRQLTHDKCSTEAA
ncbi:MAG: ATP-binding cassette domain-containing protein [Candidatus Endonucleobacter bathymodioli]|uniref:ATP-binding cassette domain-containing protein n=1 Tax=Candidatus Endonucleibacter bathymodioli TaxID=539814 RepID=A0AA90NZS5_9GAMM|nr:ATP-binding cassette domain-containing protein [Candidatus Endonucleobacter bathymodioli]